MIEREDIQRIQDDYRRQRMAEAAVAVVVVGLVLCFAVVFWFGGKP